MAQLPVTGPFGEADLRHQGGTGPVDAIARQTARLERGRWNFERRELLRQAAQHLRAEAGADFAGVAEHAAMVVADEQRAQAGTSAFGLGIAADDELLLGDA